MEHPPGAAKTMTGVGYGPVDPANEETKQVVMATTIADDMTGSVPQQLLKQATRYGLVCQVADSGEHYVQPSLSMADWQLVSQQGDWILVVKGVPQMRLHYAEALKFVERRGKTST